MQSPLKIVLNSTYGAMKDKYNNLYDPLMANNVCIAGQLLLLDLIEKVEPFGELVQSNTDGILVKLFNRKGYLAACEEWSKRTRLDLEHDDYAKVIQKDVNNYIIVDKNGDYKSKGAYVKKLSNIDYDLPILNKALINYFIYNKPVEGTINECKDLREFQQIIKVSKLYDYALHGDTKLSERVIRVFASNDESDNGIFKIKQGGNPEKVSKTPKHAFIYNDCVIGVKVPVKLDKQHYIEMAKGRISDFENGKIKVEKSDIKGVNLDVKTSILDYISTCGCEEFIDVLMGLYSNLEIRKNHIQAMIRTDNFAEFGNSKYLEKYYDLFLLFWDNKNKVLKDRITTAKVDKLQLSQDVFNAFSVKDKKYYTNVSVLNVIKSHLNTNDDYSYIEKIRLHNKYKDILDYKTGKEEHKFVVLVKEIHESKNPSGVFYSLGTGKTAKLKISKHLLNKIRVDDIVKIDHMRQIPRKVYKGGKKIEDENTKQWLLERVSKYKNWSLEEVVC